MFTLTRRRREVERQKKLEELFKEADGSNSGRISIEACYEIFENNDISVFSALKEEVEKSADGNGELKLPEFMKAAYMTELCRIEFVDRVFHKADIEDLRPKKDKKESKGSSSNEKMDKVEYAFRKYDRNKDGFLCREEFDEMMKTVEKEQADRIFKSCDTEGNGKISLEEFRSVLSKLDAE
ncbi:calcineurin subunit B type 1 [Lepeophtheirus salmonis]|nr:calcineurin subunit B type 1-like [Lepeophtheirus salmonis]